MLSGGPLSDEARGNAEQDGAGNPYERRSFALEIGGWFVSQVRGA